LCRPVQPASREMGRQMTATLSRQGTGSQDLACPSYTAGLGVSALTVRVIGVKPPSCRSRQSCWGSGVGGLTTLGCWQLQFFDAPLRSSLSFFLRPG
jgi:hypothetical protein